MCICDRVCLILDSHLLMTLSKGEGGACVYMRGARIAFYSNTIHCEESEALTQWQRVKVKRWGETSSREGCRGREDIKMGTERDKEVKEHWLSEADADMEHIKWKRSRFREENENVQPHFIPHWTRSRETSETQPGLMESFSRGPALLGSCTV